jgi:ankyrin repeat protein
MIFNAHDTLEYDSLTIFCSFLWVKLQLGSLCLAGREEGVKALLQDLPEDLDETYDRLLRRLSRSESQVLIRRMFECILAARRPLTMEELCEGMAFTIEDRCWDVNKIPPNDLQVISTYGGLVVVDEMTRVVQLAHSTIYQYLLRDRPTSCYQFSIKDANQHLGELCIAYLFFEDFKTQVPPNGIASPVSPADTVISSTDVSSITIGFRRSLPPGTPQSPSLEKFSLLRYARRNWLWHAARLTQTDHPTKRDILFQHLLTRKQLPFEFKPWRADSFLGNPYPDLVGWAVVNNNLTIISSLAEFDPMFNFKEYIRDSVNFIFKGVVSNSISREQQEAFAYAQDTWKENIPMHGWMYSKLLIACRKGNLAILNLCRPDLDKEVQPWDQLRAHLILEAAATNQNAIIDSFSLGHRRPNDQCRSFTTAYAGQLCNALERAALAGHTDMVRKLGRAGWSANIFGSDPSTGICALHNAILGNNSDVVEALLAALEITIYDPSQPVSQNDSRLGIKTAAFCKAASSGHVAVVKAFLADGASPVMANESGMNPYMQAIKDGQMDVFTLLFPLPGCGAEQNVAGLPLSMAAANGHTDIVDFLISTGASVFPSNGLDNPTPGLDQVSNMTCPTPLYAASANGHCVVVEKLLSAGAGADVISARDLLLESDGTGRDRSRGLYSPEGEPPVASSTIQLYQRPLSGAALNGQFRVVQQLLKAQALVNPRDPSENSPLLLALIGGHAEVANLLSSKGAEILNKESAEQALLSCSMGQGGPKALELLIEHGVSPNCVNFMGESGLDIATTAGLTDIMKQLIEAGADVNTRDHLSQTPLMRACSGAKFRAAWILVNSGANLSVKDQAGNSALSFASVCGDPQIVQLLLDNGAPVDSPNLVRQTPLMEACLSGDEATVKILLSHGANVHARTGQAMEHKKKRIPRGSTPLMIATIMNEASIISTLCVSGQGLEDIEFEQRRTSLLLAAENGKLATFHALVKGGASLKARSSAGLSALDLAVRGGNVEVIEYLAAIHKRELKKKPGGLLSPEEISSAMNITPKAGPLPVETLAKLRKFETTAEASDRCIPLIDPLEELFGW